MLELLYVNILLKVNILSEDKQPTSKLHKFGSVVAFIFNKLFILAFVIFILVLAPLAVIGSTFSDSGNIKKILDEGDTYTAAIDNALNIIELESKEDNLKQSESKPAKTLYQTLEENELINPDEFTNVIKNTLDKQYLKSQVEPAIDSTYSFLDSSSENLELSFTLKDRKDEFSQELKTYLNTQFSKIPECTPEQVRQFQAKEDQNLLEQDCLPAGTQVENEVNNFLNEFMEEGPFNEVYNVDKLGLSNVELNNARTVFGAMSSLPIFFWIGFVLLAAAIVMTAKTTYRGFKEVGIISFITGIILIIEFTIIGNAKNFTDRIADSEDNGVQNQAILNIVEPMAEVAANIIKSGGIMIGGIIVAIGILAFVFGIYLKRHHYEHLHIPHFGHSDKTSKT